MNTLEFDDRWFGIDIRMKLSYFLAKFKNQSHYFRCLSQGNWRFLKKSNQQFFKCFEKGLYRSVIDREEITFHFLLQHKNTNDIIKISQEFTIRMKKLMFGKIEVYPMDRMSYTNRIILQSRNRFKVFKKINKW